MKYLFSLIIVLLLAVNVQAKVHTEAVEYKQGNAVLEGYLAYDDAVKGKRPGVLIVHEWMGVNPYVKKRAEQLAKLGYVAFAADIYGKGVRPKNSEEAAAESKKYKTDRQLMRNRVNAGLDILKSHKLVETKKTAAIGYCFGGTTVLELGRSGADVIGIVSFHGGLDSPSPNDAKNIKGKVLALHGGDDPFVPAEQVAAFQDEMRKANIDWNMVIYGGAVHSFTNPDAGNDNSKGAAYNEKADKRSWEDMKQFFSEIFK